MTTFFYYSACPGCMLRLLSHVEFKVLAWILKGLTFMLLWEVIQISAPLRDLLIKNEEKNEISHERFWALKVIKINAIIKAYCR